MKTSAGPGGSALGNFPGLRGVAVWVMVLALGLVCWPDATSFAVLKGVVFLALPLVAWLSAPMHMGRALGSEVSRVSGWLALALLAWVAFGESQQSSVAPFEQLAYCGAGWMLLVWLRTMKDEELDVALRWSVTSAVLLVGAVALLQVFPQKGFEWVQFPVANHPVGTLGNRNQLGYFMALGLPEAFGVVAGDGLLAGVFGGLSVAVGVTVLALSGCRGAWLALALGGLVRFLVSAAPGRRKMVRFTFGAVLLVAALAPGLLWKGHRHVEGLFSPGKQATIHTRLFAWETTLRGIQEASWLGTGPGSFPRVYPELKEARLRTVADADFVRLARQARVKRQAHHEVLELTLEWGGVGAVLFTLLVLTWFLGGLASLEGVARPGTRKRRRVGMVILTASVVALGFHLSLQSPALALLTLFGLARYLGPYRDTVLRSTLWSIPALVGALGCLVAGGRLALWELSMQEGLAALVEGRDEEATASLKQALAVRPEGRTFNALGRIALRAGEVQDAVNLFTMAALKDPSHGHLTNLGVAEFSRKQYEPAKEALLKAWFRQPEQETGFRLGALFERLGRSKDAEGVYRRSRQLSGFSGRPGYALARMLWKRGDRDEAVEILRQEIDGATAFLPHAGSGAAQLVRIRLECMRLLLKIQEERRNKRGVAEARSLLAHLAPGIDLSRMGPAGGREGLE